MEVHDVLGITVRLMPVVFVGTVGWAVVRAAGTLHELVALVEKMKGITFAG